MLARRASVDAYRNNRRRLVPVDHLSLVGEPTTADATAPPGSDEHLDAMASREAVRWAFRRLSPRQQRLLVLRGVDQLTYQQMAAMEQTTVEALASALNRARERLRAGIDDYHKGEARRMPAVALFGLDLVRRARDRFARAQALVSPHLFELAGATMAIGIAAALSAPSPSASAAEHQQVATAFITGAAPFHVAETAGATQVAAIGAPSVPSVGSSPVAGDAIRDPHAWIEARRELAVTPDRSWMRVVVDVSPDGNNTSEAYVDWNCSNSTLGEPVCRVLDVLPGSERGPRP